MGAAETWEIGRSADTYFFKLPQQVQNQKRSRARHPAPAARVSRDAPGRTRHASAMTKRCAHPPPSALAKRAGRGSIRGGSARRQRAGTHVRQPASSIHVGGGDRKKERERESPCNNRRERETELQARDVYLRFDSFFVAGSGLPLSLSLPPAAAAAGGGAAAPGRISLVRVDCRSVERPAAAGAVFFWKLSKAGAGAGPGSGHPWPASAADSAAASAAASGLTTEACVPLEAGVVCA